MYMRSILVSHLALLGGEVVSDGEKTLRDMMPCCKVKNSNSPSYTPVMKEIKVCNHQVIYNIVLADLIQ